MEVPDESQIAAVKAASQRRSQAGGDSSGPGSLPSWKLTRGTQVYRVGGLSLALKPLSRRPARRVYDLLQGLPLMVQVAAQSGLDQHGVRLDFDRMAAILSAVEQVEISPEVAAAAWREFASSLEMDEAISLLAEALFPFLDDPASQRLAWPRPILPAALAEGEGNINEWESECERIVAAALANCAAQCTHPSGFRWLDDAIEDELHELEIPLLLTVLFDVQGGFPGDVRERFTRP